MNQEVGEESLEKAAHYAQMMVSCSQTSLLSEMAARSVDAAYRAGKPVRHVAITAHRAENEEATCAFLLYLHINKEIKLQQRLCRQRLLRK